MTYDEFRATWAAMTEKQKDRVRAKAQWEHVSLWKALNEWPDLARTETGGER